MNIAKEKYNIRRYVHRKNHDSIKSNSFHLCCPRAKIFPFFFLFSFSKISRSFYFRPRFNASFIAGEIFSRNFQYTRRGGLREQRMEKNLNGELKVSLCATRFSTFPWKLSIISIQKIPLFRLDSKFNPFPNFKNSIKKLKLTFLKNIPKEANLFKLHNSKWDQSCKLILKKKKISLIYNKIFGSEYYMEF